MNKRLFFLLALLFFISVSEASQVRFEELKNQIINMGDYGNSQPLDSLYRLAFFEGEKSQVYEGLAQLYVMFGARHLGIVPNLDTCFHYLQKAEKLSRSKKIYRSLSKSQIYLAHYFNLIGDREESIDHIRKARYHALKVTEPLHQQHLIGFIAITSGDIYKSFNLYDSALRNYQRAIDISYKSKNRNLEFNALNRLGKLHELHGEEVLASQLYRRVMESAAQSDLALHIAMAAHNLADIYLLRNNLDSALYYYRKSFDIREKHNRPSITVSTSLAKAYSLLHEPDSSFYYLNAIDTSNLNGIDKHNLLSAYSMAYLSDGQFDKALVYNIRDTQLSAQRGDLKWQIEALEDQVKIYRSKENPVQALSSFEQLKILEDSLFDMEKSKTLLELNAKYESAQKEQKIASLAQQNQIQNLQYNQQRIILIATVAVLFLVVFLAIILFNHRMTKSAQKQLVLEQNLLRAQMNPHFIFNALASIQGFITRNNRQEAATYLAKFGELTRDILEASRKELISLTKEIEMIRNYIDLEQVRFSKSLELEININDLSSSDVMIPPMMIQPFLENSIRHGFKGSERGKIIICIKKMDQMLNISILDDGQGITNESVDLKKSLATKIVQERLQHLKGYTRKMLFNIYNKKDDHGNIVGVHAIMNLPLKYV